MKKENQIPVDEYFRQREAEIPVTFDPKHWEQLSAALDAAARPETLPTVTPRNTPRNIKGWWVSGIWILLLLTSAWIFLQRVDGTVPVPGEVFQEQQMAPAVPHQKPAPAQPAMSGASEETNVQKEKFKKENSAPGAIEENWTPAETGRVEATAPDSTRNLPAISPVSLPDSASTTPKKKKKHIFW